MPNDTESSFDKGLVANFVLYVVDPVPFLIYIKIPRSNEVAKLLTNGILSWTLGRINIITGPNYSGKSVYVKQVYICLRNGYQVLLNFHASMEHFALDYPYYEIKQAGCQIVFQEYCFHCFQGTLYQLPLIILYF